MLSFFGVPHFAVLALTKRNSNVMTILLFLHKIISVFTEYFGQLEEESLRDNFVLVYELLDEMMDYGHPQTSETNILKQYFTPLLRSVTLLITSNTILIDLSLKKASSWRQVQGLPHQPSAVPSVGDLKESSIEKTKCFWMSSTP